MGEKKATHKLKSLHHFGLVLASGLMCTGTKITTAEVKHKAACEKKAKAHKAKALGKAAKHKVKKLAKAAGHAMKKMLKTTNPKKKMKAKSAFESLVKREKAAKVHAKKATGVMHKSDEKAKKATHKLKSLHPFGLLLFSGRMCSGTKKLLSHKKH